MYDKVLVNEDFLKRLRAEGNKLVDIFRIFRALPETDKNNIRLLGTVALLLKQAGLPFSKKEVKDALKFLRKSNDYLNHFEGLFMSVATMKDDKTPKT